MKKHLYFILVCLGAAIPLMAATTMPPSMLSARAMGMGGAATALSTGPDAIFYNWATTPPTKELALNVFQGTQLQRPFLGVTGHQTALSSVWRFGMIYSAERDFKETALNTYSQPLATGKTFSSVLQQGYISTQIPFIWRSSVGIRLRRLSETLHTQTSHTSGIDVAGYRQFDLGIGTLGTGLTAYNFLGNTMTWSSGYTEKLPRRVRAGVAYSAHNNLLHVDIDLERASSRWSTYIGSEYWILGQETEFPSLALRLGASPHGLALGLGMQFRQTGLNYAYLNPNATYLDNMHRLSLTWQRQPRVARANQIDVPLAFSPIQETLPGEEDVFQVETAKDPNLYSIMTIQITESNFRYKISQEHPALTWLHHDEPLSNRDLTLTLPLQLEAMLENLQYLVVLDLERNKNGHLLFTGYLPPGFQFLLNDDVITPRANGAFYHKVLVKNPEAPLALELILYRSDQ